MAGSDDVESAFEPDEPTTEPAAAAEPVSPAQEQEEQEIAAVKLQAMRRGKAARGAAQQDKEQGAAAIKLQAMQRGKRARQTSEFQRAALERRESSRQAGNQGATDRGLRGLT